MIYRGQAYTLPEMKNILINKKAALEAHTMAFNTNPTVTKKNRIMELTNEITDIETDIRIFEELTPTN